jgi:hypothetical protein
MAFRCLLVLSICAIGRKERPSVNTQELACKLLKMLDGAEETVDATIMDGQGTI